MKYVISAAHRRFYEENGVIEFEDFFSLKKISDWKEEGKVYFQEEKDLFNSFWYSDKLKRLDTQRKLIEVAKQFTDERSLVLGFDLWFDSPFGLDGETVDSLFPFQGIVCGFIVAFDDSNVPFLEEPSFFPKKRGSVTFIGSKKPIDFTLFSEEKSLFLLIAFGHVGTVFVRKERKEESLLIKRGYSYGDCLTDRGHSVL